MAKMIARGMLVAGVAGGLVLLAGSARAQTFPFPAKGAALYKTNFARAVDSCTGSAVTVHVGTNQPQYADFPQFGCVASVTDSLAFGKATLTLHKAHGKFVLAGNGFQTGDLVHLRLNIQVTRTSVVHSVNKCSGGANDGNPCGSDTECPGGTCTLTGSDTVTFPPQDFDCVQVAADAKGVVLQKAFLDSCVNPFPVGAGTPTPPVTDAQRSIVDPTPPAKTTPAQGGGGDSKTGVINLQILGASLVNDTTGNVFATAGLVR